MHRPTNIVHSGWMTKSPPEQKLQSSLKIFRAVSFRFPFKLSSTELETSLSLTSYFPGSILCKQDDMSVRVYVLKRVCC